MLDGDLFDVVWQRGLAGAERRAGKDEAAGVGDADLLTPCREPDGEGDGLKHRGNRGFISFVRLLKSRHGRFQIPQQAIMQPVNPAMDR